MAGARRPPVANEFPCRVVHRVQLLGSQATRFSWVLSEFAPFAGLCLGAGSLQALLLNLNDALLAQGYVTYYQKKRKLLSTKVTRIHQEAQMETVVPSEISAGSISIGAGGDVNVVASTLTADGAIGLHAGRDLSLLSTGEHNYAYESRKVTKRGVFGGDGLSIVVGTSTRNEVTQSRGTQQIGAAVASIGGDVVATAGNQYLQLSSELLSPVGDIHIAAKEVAIQTSNNTLSVLNSIRQTQTGLTLSASHPLVQAGQTVNDMQDARERTSNPRMRALALMTSGLTMFSAYDALAGTKGGVLDYASNGWSIQASLGYSASTFESVYNTSLPQESVIVAGGDISVSATGSAAAEQGDISVLGSALTASGNLTLRAENDIHLLAATGTTTEQTRTRASSGAIGLKAGVGGSGAGLSVTLAASRTRGFTNGWGTTYFPVELTAGRTLTLDSGRHTELVGATAGGYRVDATVGSKGSGNLVVASPTSPRNRPLGRASPFRWPVTTPAWA
jgi:filamentous hemagglutinin